LAAVSVRRSLQNDHLVCLEDGRKFKSLKRHLRTMYGLSPDEYRAKWKLPKDYPMVAPAYSAARSELAKAMGLGAVRKATPEPPITPTPAKAAPKVKARLSGPEVPFPFTEKPAPVGAAPPATPKARKPGRAKVTPADLGEGAKAAVTPAE